jgi:hypothetical protein
LSVRIFRARDRLQSDERSHTYAADLSPSDFARFFPWISQEMLTKTHTEGRERQTDRQTEEKRLKTIERECVL